MGSTRVKLVLGFTVFFLLSSIFFANSLNFVEAAPPPDKEKAEKKYPYELSEVKCIDNNWWVIVYLVESPNKKTQIFSLIIQENCNPPPPNVDTPYFILKDGYLNGETYFPSDSYVFEAGNFTASGLPVIVAPVAKDRQFTTITKITNNLDEGVDVHYFPKAPEPYVTALQVTPSPCQISSKSSCEFRTEWRCNEEVTRAEYSILFIGYPTSFLSSHPKLSLDGSYLRNNGEHLKVNNTITCLESVDQSGTVTFSETSESTAITVTPVSEPPTNKPPGKEKTPKEKGPKGVEPQGIITASGNYLPPVKQMKMGITAEEVICNEGKELVFKSSDGSPKCVSSIAAEKLVARGWATK